MRAITEADDPVFLERGTAPLWNPYHRVTDNDPSSRCPFDSDGSKKKQVRIGGLNTGHISSSTDIREGWSVIRGRTTRYSDPTFILGRVV